MYNLFISYWDISIHLKGSGVGYMQLVSFWKRYWKNIYCIKWTNFFSQHSTFKHKAPHQCWNKKILIIASLPTNIFPGQQMFPRSIFKTSKMSIFILVKIKTVWWFWSMESIQIDKNNNSDNFYIDLGCGHAQNLVSSRGNDRDTSSRDWLQRGLSAVWQNATRLS